MTWKNEIRKGIFDKDPEEMTDFMNVTPRLKEASKKRKEVRNSLGGVSAKDMHEYLQGELYKLRGGSELTKMDIKILELLQAVDQHGLGD